MVDNRGVLSASGIPEMAPGGGRAPRVVLADDDVLLREGLASLLDLPESDTDHRRVLAVLRFLDAR
jgi:hypothetical protein